MTKEEDIKPKPGEMVVLMEVPPGMLDDLPPEDQQAINEVVGKPILLNEYDEDGRADLEFKDRHGNFHYNLCSSGIHQGSRTERVENTPAILGFHFTKFASQSGEMAVSVPTKGLLKSA
jgi:hypothetical protein